MSTRAIPAADTRLPPVFGFRLRLRRKENGPELESTPVPESYIADIHAELWRDGFLRRGQPTTSFAELDFAFTPVYPESQRSATTGRHTCHAFDAVCRSPNGEVFRRRYTAAAFADVATTAAQELVRQGVLKDLDTYCYELLPVPTQREPSVALDHSFQLDCRPVALPYLSVPVEKLKKRAEHRAKTDGEDFPVVYTRQAITRAEEFARRGAISHPPRETGCALVGFVCSCPDTGEFFPVVTDALEATDAQEKSLSLTYSGKTWRRMQAVVAAKQTQLRTGAFRMLGQAHGHNFLPSGGAAPCDACPKVDVCSQTSVFVSIDDRIWSQSVFSRQPWALCHIFGLSARKEQVQGVFTLHDNRLMRRSFYVIDSFDHQTDAH